MTSLSFRIVLAAALFMAGAFQPASGEIIWKPSADGAQTQFLNPDDFPGDPLLDKIITSARGERVQSDGSRSKPFCSWAKKCVWDAATQTKCAAKLCEANGFTRSKFLSASNDMCTASATDNKIWYWSTDNERYKEGTPGKEASITARCWSRSKTIPPPQAKSPSTPSRYKSREAFGSDQAYAKYMKKSLKPGMRVELIVSDATDKIKKGARGTFHHVLGGSPPLFVRWDGIKPNGCFAKGKGGAPDKDDKSGWCVEYDEIRIVGPGARYKSRKDFGSGDAYANYLKKTLKAGMKVRAIVDKPSKAKKIKRGATGTFHNITSGIPPVFVRWDGLKPSGCFRKGKGGAPDKDDKSGWCVTLEEIEIVGAGGGRSGPAKVMIKSDGTRKKPLCSWTKKCHWDAKTKEVCARKLCEASGYKNGAFQWASNDMCKKSATDKSNWYWSVDKEKFGEGKWGKEAYIKAQCW